jgi:hypothetical protein
MTSTNESLLSRILGIGAAFTTVFLMTGSVTDPVNVTKFVSLGVVAFMATALILNKGGWKQVRDQKYLLALLLFFNLAALISTLVSELPLTQNLYGVYGRNNGFLTYLFLSLVLLTSLALKRQSSFEYVLKALMTAGVINVIYCLWVLSFGDFIGWSNPYGNILGTLGNPNFIGSFLGIFFSVLLAYLVSSRVNRLGKILGTLVLLITLYEIIGSNAIQGRVLAAVGIAVVSLSLIRVKFGHFTLLVYSGVTATAGVFALLGSLQIGPLTSFIYKTSVSLRGEYWQAGWNTGLSNPLTGAGMDGFGDWYRRARDDQALVLPGVNTVTNASHNVPLDMFAFGGWPLFISYLLIVGISGYALLKANLRRKNFDPVLVAITVAWICYQLQSIISINQIGLAVWGWLLCGIAISYEKSIRENVEQSAQKEIFKKGTKNLAPHITVSVASLGLAGLLLSLPPLLADNKLQESLQSRQIGQVEEVLKPSYFNPQNASNYLTIIQALENSNFPDLAHKYALEATDWNPENFYLWMTLYALSKSTEEEKVLAVENMKRLDPLNPDVTEIQ